MTARHPAAHPTAPTLRSRLGALAIGVLILGGVMPTASALAADPGSKAPDGAMRPTVQYEEALAHADDKIAFTAGDRVTVPFKPRSSDRWVVGGVAPRALPAGRLSGRALRLGADPASGPRVSPSVTTGEAVGAADVPYVGPDAPTADLAAAVDPGALRREVFGFLPYWELSDSSTRLDWEKLSTIAYFGVGAAGNGDLQKTNADGSTTVGWSGWTSSKMTGVINAAHRSGARVVLTVQSFAWSSAGVKKQKALLGSSTARANLARQIATAVRDRGADGVNLDFEPLVATYADEFTALVRKVRTELNRVARGYQLTFDTTGWIGNYPIEAATASGGADAVVIMGYDYRSGSSNPVGSVAPVGGPTYDVADTIRAYLNRLPSSKVILAVPYYGRAWSTATSSIHSKNISGTKNGASTTVVYTTAVAFAADHGRKWDAIEGSAWTVYRRQTCTAAYGCVKPWRQLYYDDAKALGLKYDLVNRYNLRGAGIWALGYDGTRTELYQVLKDKFITDSVPPAISSSALSQAVISPNGDGALDSTVFRLNVTGHIKFGWAVQPLVAGKPGRAVRTGAVMGKSVVFEWNGRNDGGAIVRDGQYRVTLWAADASNNRATSVRVVTVDRRPAGVTLTSAPGFISPDGDRHADRMALSVRTDEPVTGTARILDRNGDLIRKWTFSRARDRDWVWDGKDRSGRTVPDGRYTFRVRGLDHGANPTSRDLTLRVDRTIRAVTWSRSSFIARPGESSRVSVVIARRATVSLRIYAGRTLVRSAWVNRSFAAGTYRWSWDGRTAAGVRLKPGTYTAVVTAVSSIGWSDDTKAVVIRVP